MHTEINVHSPTNAQILNARIRTQEKEDNYSQGRAGELFDENGSFYLKSVWPNEFFEIIL